MSVLLFVASLIGLGAGCDDDDCEVGEDSPCPIPPQVGAGATGGEGGAGGAGGGGAG